jgi:hypothetical protein
LEGLASGKCNGDRKGKSPVHPVGVQKQQTENKEKGENEQWKKPLEGWLKCNVDASYLGDEKKGGGVLYFMTMRAK